MATVSQRFGAARRLKRPADFAAVRSRSARAECGTFFLRLRLRRTGEGPEPARLGLVASRKVGNAVVRNRAKRRFREIFRKHPEVLPAYADVVVICRAAVATEAFAALESAFLRGVEKAQGRARRPSGDIPSGGRQ
ncbi:MAG: ribonuclease P protein component [Opitutales bacterium]